MSEARLFTTIEAGAYLGVSRRTLEAWRRTGLGPVYVRLGQQKIVRYHEAELLRFAGMRAFSSTSEENLERKKGGSR